MVSRGMPLPAYDPKSERGGVSDFFTTRLETMVAWARANSLWPLPFATACCGIEFMSVVSSHYDLSRFGAEVVRVDVYVPGCPPTPEELMYGILELQRKIRSGEKSRDDRSAAAAAAVR